MGSNHLGVGVVPPPRGACVLCSHPPRTRLPPRPPHPVPGRLYDRTLSLYLDKAKCRGNRTAALNGLCRLGEAIKECEEALQIDPYYGHTHHRLASLHIRYVIAGGGNAAGYVARTFVEHDMADGRLCVVSKEIAPAKREGLPLSHLEILDAVVIPNRANVKGYFVWSFLDVFELLAGYYSRYGLYHVKFQDPELQSYRGRQNSLRCGTTSS
uniref:Uncharacterized protein n=1 Tax=Zea mays TaxID=4577 RepID=A0A804PFT5_MAIZE